MSSWFWHHACAHVPVPEMLPAPMYDQPTVMWRMRRSDGLSAHAVIGPGPDGAVVVWFVNDRPVGYRDFDDWSGAIQWSDQLQAQNWAIGWRLEIE